MRTKIMLLANKISLESKSGVVIKTSDPEYRILDPLVSDEMADVAMGLKVRKPRTAEDVASRCGKSVKETEKILWDLAMAGICMVEEIDGADRYSLEIWVPGIMEFVVNSREIVAKYPQVAACFEEYTRKRTLLIAPNTPIGKGPMRVIPIETAIAGENLIASYEQVSTYLNENELFSVTDCACRAAREAMGEGCGHLKEDMCIQLGKGAEYYIRTGRARQITREEAFAIIKRAEENGFVHQITNWEGVGKAIAICNCCGCSCFALRIAKYYNTPDISRSNYVARVDQEKCVACGECVENCPTNALQLGQKLCTEPPDAAPEHVLPRETLWTRDKWNPDYRINRKVVLDSGSSPCKAECPAHIGVQGYIKLAAQGRYTEALELIKKENPFPAVCGRVCPRYCESACTRGDVDDPIAIDDIKKFIAEQDLKADTRFVPKKRHAYGKPIAVIGGGPAGLSCAYYLAIDGYKVTVFEKQQALGGMLTFGIPSYRLEKDVINAEIDILRELGVQLKCGVEVGRDASLDELRTQGFKAFYIAIGAQAGRLIGVAGEDAKGVITGVDFLRTVNLDESVRLTGQTIVIGGGNVAIDVARTAVRTGSSKVEMFCLESREEMPALDEEIDEALAEAIGINNSWGPKRILAKNGKVVGVEFKKCLAVFDENRRFSPSFDENDTKVVKADNVLLSVGQAMDWGKLIEGSRIELNPNRTIKADPTTFQTGEPDVFAGGDALTGPKFAIDAIALGKEGAISIHRYVQPGQSLILGRLKRDYRPLDKDTLDLDSYDRLPRQKVEQVDARQSKETFRDLRGTLTEEQLRKETERCLGCGATVVDEYMCVGCGQCTTKCMFEAISLVRKHDETSMDYEKLMPTVVASQMLKRGAMIAARKMNDLVRGDSAKD